MPRTRFNSTKALIATAIPFGAGTIGSLVTSPAIQTWYADLVKPAFNPPNWIFGPVWTLLYIFQAIAFYQILTRSSPERSRAIWLFCLQAIANAGWSIVFFGLHLPEVAVVEIIVLWGLILATIISFRRISRLASLLLWPYLAWVTFATMLTIAIARLN